MIRDILTYEKDKEILTQKSEPVKEITEEIKELIQDLKDTLAIHEGGVGISAIQIGIPKRVCLIKYNGTIYTLINPEITKTRGEIDFEEGCLSVPGLATKTKRAQKVWCSYMDEDGRQKELANGGLCSVIIQHELDHFEGICPLFNAYEEAFASEPNKENNN